MFIQLEIFRRIVSDLKKDHTIESILLTGSVSDGTATELSDLDMIVLGQKEAFVSYLTDGVFVEIFYTTFNNAVEKLKTNPMEAYKYLDAKIEYDNGRGNEIIEYAENILDHFCVSEKERSEICYWLKSTALKMKSAFLKQDAVLISYLTATNTWKVLEGIWAVNQKPIPPSSSLYRRYKDLKNVPYPHWFENLLTGSAENRGKAIIEIIDWILKQLNEK